MAKMMASNELIDWLNEEMKRRGWGVRETARNAGISHTPISYILNGEQPSFETCVALAKAFNLPPEVVFRKAGLIENKSDEDSGKEELVQSIAHKVSLLSDEEQKMVDSLVETMLKRHKDWEENETPNKKLPFSRILKAWTFTNGLAKSSLNGERTKSEKAHQ